jgi:hypothetical protein
MEPDKQECQMATFTRIAFAGVLLGLTVSGAATAQQQIYPGHVPNSYSYGGDSYGGGYYQPQPDYGYQQRQWQQQEYQRQLQAQQQQDWAYQQRLARKQAELNRRQFGNPYYGNPYGAPYGRPYVQPQPQQNGSGPQNRQGQSYAE